jgi:exonuclease 3'-5' domain-containing protein 1
MHETEPFFSIRVLISAPSASNGNNCFVGQKVVARRSGKTLEIGNIYIGLEGVNLCREGSLSILTLLIDTGITTIPVYLIDVYSLGSKAFNTTGIKRKMLKDILQDDKISKVFFDVRNDSDTLFAHFDVVLQGVEDVQLIESAIRTTTSSRKYLNGLAKCIEQGVLYGSGLMSWKLAKENGRRLFKSELGGSYQVFEQRPIPNEIISYCVSNVQYLPKLWSRFRWNYVPRGYSNEDDD